MRIIFMGTPALAVPALEKLIGSHHEIAAVVTQPDRASGRGRQIVFSPVKQCAIEHDLPVLQPENISEPSVLDELESYKADVFAVVAYAQKLTERLLLMAPFGCINLHPSLLPKYRGSAPFRGPILNGDKTTGVTIMKLVEKWDAGDILLQEEFELGPKDTAVDIEEKAVIKGADLLLAAVDGLEKGSIVPVPQDDSKATYLKQIKKEEGIIDFSAPAVNIERQIRACVPWPSAYTFFNGKVFKIWNADVIPEPARNQENKVKEPCPYKEKCTEPHDGNKPDKMQPGYVIWAAKDMLIIRCGKDCLKVNEVQLEGKKRMKTEDFLRGTKLETGTVLGR